MTERRYHLPRVRLLIARTILAFMLVILVVFVVINASKMPVWLWPFEIAAVGWATWQAFLARIEPGESRDGFELRNQMTYRWQVVPWAEIEHFEEGPLNGLTQLRSAMIVTRNGMHVSLGSIAARRTVFWDGGETDDIVGELNRRLDGWRAEAAGDHLGPAPMSDGTIPRPT